MTTDRDLLELAAKAAGYEFKWGITDPMIRCHEPAFPNKTHNLWNPLEDDGDALRLAVTLGLRVYVYAVTAVEMGHTVVAGEQRGCHAIEGHDTNPCAATRRAIVRAAAALASHQGTTGEN
jgi:hypothetical protein